MPTRRQFFKTTATAAAAYTLTLSPPLCAEGAEGRAKKKEKTPDTTFILASDTHYSSVDENHPASHAMVNAINQIADGKTLWPKTLGGKATGFSCAGKPIDIPKGIVHLGDMTDFGSKRELNGGKGYFGLKKRWWAGSAQQQLLDATIPYSNIIGLCHGHSHATGLYKKDHLRIIRCNNMGWEIKHGNKDGHGSFAIIHADQKHFNLMHIDCIAADGTFRFRPQHHFPISLT